jgi:DNA-binding winged helix-turn-helix (wHTH) protein/tetratricopeptide (TPR) repeat protein
MMVRSSDKSSMRSYAFGRWVLQGNWLMGDQGEGVHLPPKELAVLGLLLDADGALVTKDSLLDSVWPGCDVAEESLTRCIYSLRKLLGHNKDYISTAYGKGYRFVSPVIELKEPQASSSATSLLVLPFRGDTAFLSAQVHEQITRRLTAAFAGTLSIMPASLTAGQSCGGDTLALVERLAPDFYLSGRCASVHGQIELSIELARTRDHVLLHSQVIRNEGVEAVIEAVVLMVAQRLPGMHPRKESCSSYPLALAYLNGLTGLQAYTPQSLNQALQQFRHCVRLDEGYAPPWCGVAEAWLALASLGLCPEHQAFEQAQYAIGKALALEPSNHAALLRLALLTSLQGSVDAAQALFQRSLLAGDHADAYYHYAWHQWACGREAQAADSIDICLGHDPDSVAAKILRLRISVHRQPQEACATIHQALSNGLDGHPVVLGMASMLSAATPVAGAAYPQSREAIERSTFDVRNYWRLSTPGRPLGICLARVPVSRDAPACRKLVTSDSPQRLFIHCTEARPQIAAASV